MKYPRKLMRPFENHWQPLIAYENVLFVAGSAEFFVNRTTQINWKEEKKMAKKAPELQAKAKRTKKSTASSISSSVFIFPCCKCKLNIKRKVEKAWTQNDR